MKRLAWWLVLVLVVVLAGLFFIKDPGTVSLSFMGWQVETNFVIFAVGLVVLYVLLNLALRIIRGVIGLPRWWRSRSARRRKAKARQELESGLVDFAEGRWRQSEKKLLRHVSDSDTPLINYLAAAHAAQRVGDLNRRDTHLRSAYEAMPKSEIAIGLTQAELQLSAEQYEQALATLRHLHELEPSHEHVMRLLAHAYRQVGDWEGLMRLLPALRRMKVQTLPESELITLEVDALLGQLRRAEAQGLDAVTRLWMEARRPIAEREEVIIEYARILCRLGQFETAATLLERRLKSRWSEALVSLWSHIQHDNPQAALGKAEAWLRMHPESVAAHLAVAQLAMELKQLDKARGHLEHAAKLAPSGTIHRMLGQICEAMHDAEGAARHYAEALTLITTASPEPVAKVPQAAVAGLLPNSLPVRQ